MSDSVPLSTSVPSPASSNVLCLDTATERLHIALAVGESVHTQDLPGGAQASTALLPALQALLQASGLRWADVDAIAFGSGPGAFTGLRTACSVTQGLALGLGCPVIALDTLMVVAEDARQRAVAVQPQACPPGQTLWVLQDARMGELYAAAFTWDGQGWQPGEGPALWPLAEPLRRWGGEAPPGLRLCGNALVQCAQALAGLPEAAILPGGAQAVPSGAAQARLAMQAWHAGRSIDAALALPRYVRDKVAQTTQERLAERSTAAPRAAQA